jgi:hypothetical protein
MRYALTLKICSSEAKVMRYENILAAKPPIQKLFLDTLASKSVTIFENLSSKVDVMRYGRRKCVTELPVEIIQ